MGESTEWADKRSGWMDGWISVDGWIVSRWMNKSRSNKRKRRGRIAKRKKQKLERPTKKSKHGKKERKKNTKEKNAEPAEENMSKKTSPARAKKKET